MLTPASHFASCVVFFPQRNKDVMPFCNTTEAMQAFKTGLQPVTQTPSKFEVPEEVMTLGLLQGLANKVATWVTTHPAEVSSLKPTDVVAYIDGSYKLKEGQRHLAEVSLHTLDPESKPNLGETIISEVTPEITGNGSVFSAFWRVKPSTNSNGNMHQYPSQEALLAQDFAARNATKSTDKPSFYAGIFVLRDGTQVPLTYDDEKNSAQLLASKLNAQA